jgi:hypothetical protein
VIALLVCAAIVAPFAGLFFRLGQWWERTRPEAEHYVLPLPLVHRHPSCERRHVSLHVVPDLDDRAVVIPIFDFDHEEPTPA